MDGWEILLRLLGVAVLTILLHELSHAVVLAKERNLAGAIIGVSKASIVGGVLPRRRPSFFALLAPLPLVPLLLLPFLATGVLDLPLYIFAVVANVLGAAGDIYTFFALRGGAKKIELTVWGIAVVKDTSVIATKPMTFCLPGGLFFMIGKM